MTEITAKQVMCTTELLTLHIIHKGCLAGAENKPACCYSFGQVCLMQHPLSGVDKHFWYMFPIWRSTWSETSLDPEGGTTVLVQYCVQANDSLLVQLIILSAGEHTGRHRYPLYPRFSPYRVSKPVSQCKEKKRSFISYLWVQKLGPAFVDFTNHQLSGTTVSLVEKMATHT